MSVAIGLKVVAFLATLFVFDRLLRWMERRGWIYYRNSKAGRGAIGYHMLEMSSAFDPGHRYVQEIQALEQKQVDDSGDPLGSGRPDLGEPEKDSTQ